MTLAALHAATPAVIAARIGIATIDHTQSHELVIVCPREFGSVPHETIQHTAWSDSCDLLAYFKVVAHGSAGRRGQ